MRITPINNQRQNNKQAFGYSMPKINLQSILKNEHCVPSGCMTKSVKELPKLSDFEKMIREEHCVPSGHCLTRGVLKEDVFTPLFKDEHPFEFGTSI